MYGLLTLPRAGASEYKTFQSLGLVTNGIARTKGAFQVCVPTNDEGRIGSGSLLIDVEGTGRRFEVKQNTTTVLHCLCLGRAIQGLQVEDVRKVSKKAGSLIALAASKNNDWFLKQAIDELVAEADSLGVPINLRKLNKLRTLVTNRYEAKIRNQNRSGLATGLALFDVLNNGSNHNNQAVLVEPGALDKPLPPLYSAKVYGKRTERG